VVCDSCGVSLFEFLLEVEVSGVYGVSDCLIVVGVVVKPFE
jgi:hypothetical protein